MLLENLYNLVWQINFNLPDTGECVIDDIALNEIIIDKEDRIINNKEVYGLQS